MSDDTKNNDEASAQSAVSWPPAAEDMATFAERFLANGRTFRDFTELTPESMDVFYLTAYSLYNARKFEDAEKVFRFLCLLNHFEAKYWKGLAASRENLGNHEGALQAYGYLTMMDLKDPAPPFHGAKCLLALGRVEEAVAGLRAAIANSEGRNDMADLHQKAVGLMEIVEKARQTSNESGK